MRKILIGFLAALLVLCGTMSAYALDGYNPHDFYPHESKGDISIVCPNDQMPGEMYGLVNTATREVIAPCVYDAMYFMSGGKVLAVQGKVIPLPFGTGEADDLQYFEIDYNGRVTPVHIDGNVCGVDPETGYIILSKPKFFPHFQAPADASDGVWGYVYALLDNHYQPVVDYILDQAHLHRVLEFRDGIAVIRTGRTFWASSDAPGGIGTGGLFGVIDLTGTFVIPPEYNMIQYLGNGIFEARTIAGNGAPGPDGPFITIPLHPSKWPSGWAQAAVESALLQRLVPVNLQSDYTKPITRAEFCALAGTLYEKITGDAIEARMTFTDCSDAWVEKLGGIGVVSGTGNGAFSPDAPLNREQAAVILANLSAALGQPLAAASANFADTASAADWALPAIGQTQAAGILNGIGNNLFAPKATYTREQSIVTMVNLSAFLQ